MSHDYEKWKRVFVAAWGDYVKVWRLQGGQNYWHKTFQDVDSIFNELTEVIGKRNGWNAAICGGLYNASTDKGCAMRCPGIVSLLLYMRGYYYAPDNWEKNDVHARSAEGFKKYLQCILATEAILQLYGKSNEHLEVVQTISEVLINGDDTWKNALDDEICKGRVYGKFIFGSGILGESIRHRLKELENEWKGRGGRSRRKESGKCTWNDTVQREEEQPISSDTCGTEFKPGQVDKDTADILQLIAVNTTLRAKAFKRIMQNVFNWKGKCDMGKKIRNRIQQGIKDVGATVNTGKAPKKETSNTPARNPPTGRPRPGTGPGRTPERGPTQSKPPHASLPKNPTAADDQLGAKAKPTPPAKPVAATPVATKTTSGSGMTTTSSGGGGGKTGQGAAGGVSKGKGKTTTKQEDCPWKTILQEHRKQVYVLQNYDREDLETMNTALHNFIDYMEQNHELVDAFGANCYNAGWEDISSDGHFYMGQTVADVVRCKLMTGALMYANGDNTQEKKAHGGSTDMSELETQLRCELANALGYILEKKYCAHQTGLKRGIKYARHTVKAMGGIGGIQEHNNGPVMNGDCTECGYKVTHGSVRVVHGELVNLLIEAGKIMDKIGQLEHSTDCSEKWEDYKSRQQSTGGTKVVNTTQFPEVKKKEKEIIKITKEAVEEVKKKIDEELEKKKGKDTTRKHTDHTTATDYEPIRMDDHHNNAHAATTAQHPTSLSRQ
ncbi:hypothetical protein AK88_04612 [Plasmodium fragile]|uniref:Schizont-infected cell agglutination extracellular alpha domain-containing protein n=1 Tax=Plasmodium fragile TaxID=5857 RepID=A0A0D9QG08_PLAFR|nr:uncharacterized protein AK88_04612 [Plasmodium fragile]KJP85742.1 hypothetical protein AK88_04612 [Plasmodium fragile]